MRFLLLLPLALGCTRAQIEQMHELRDKRSLGEAADAYWLAVRWNNVPAVSAFLSEGADQLKVARMMADGRTHYTETRLLQVVLGPEFEKDKQPELREGTVLVRVEGYDNSGTKLTVQTIEQHWKRLQLKGWLVDTKVSPIDEDVPW